VPRLLRVCHASFRVSSLEEALTAFLGALPDKDRGEQTQRYWKGQPALIYVYIYMCICSWQSRHAARDFATRFHRGRWRSLKLKARTSLLPHFSEKKRSSFEL